MCVRVRVVGWVTSQKKHYQYSLLLVVVTPGEWYDLNRGQSDWFTPSTFPAYARARGMFSTAMLSALADLSLNDGLWDLVRNAAMQ